MEENEFENIVLEVLDNLPENFSSRLENIGLVIDDSEPPKGKLTLGLYQGVPATRRTFRGRRSMPDKITLYKKAIERISPTDEDVKKNVRRVILHEIGHYFGLDEQRLRRLGY